MEDKQEESILVDGLFFDRPREGAPAFVKGRVAINSNIIEFYKKHANEAGYINADLLESKDGKKLYFKLDTWKPEVKKEDDAVDNGPF